MTIRYIHNDPASIPSLESQRAAHARRAGALAGFDLGTGPPEQVFASNDADFAYWQCREASLLALDAWESVAGPLRTWQDGSRTLAVHSNHTQGLEAAYDRSSLSFGRWPILNQTFFVAASTDAVSHEAGHAILDAIRPPLWDSFFAEVAAFHEGFADCISLLVALRDPVVVAALFASAAQPARVLDAPNAASSVAESFAAAFATSFGAAHPASRARKLKNQLQWAIPSVLPPNPTPTNLSREPHSFGRVFTGCFYDVIENIFASKANHDRASLAASSETAGSLLAEAARSAPEEIRFFRSVGRAMIVADEVQNGGANRVAIRDAFAGHSVALGTSAMLAPTTAIDGPIPNPSGARATSLPARTRLGLVSRLGAARDTRVRVEPVRIGGRRLMQARLRRRVDLTGGDASLAGVVAQQHDSLLLAPSRQHCLVLGELPNLASSDAEVGAFVQSLSESGALRSKSDSEDRIKPTHGVRRAGRHRVLRRVRFSCQ